VPWGQPANDGTDDSIADDTDSSVECDIPIHRPTSPEAPQMTYSPSVGAPQHPTTAPLSAINTQPPNSPNVLSDISNPANPKPIAVSGSQDPPVPDTTHPGETRNEWAEGPSHKQTNEINSTGGPIHRCGRARPGRPGKKRSNLFFITHKPFCHRFYPYF